MVAFGLGSVNPYKSLNILVRTTTCRAALQALNTHPQRRQVKTEIG